MAFKLTFPCRQDCALVIVTLHKRMILCLSLSLSTCLSLPLISPRQCG